MTAILDFLSGKKTYFVAAVTAALAIADAMGYMVPAPVYAVLAALGLTTLRAAAAKAE